MPTIPTITLSPGMIQWISILLSIVVTLAIKEWATSLVKGLRFKYNSDFTHGQKVYLDDKQAVIISIGMRTTIFQTKTGDEYRWRYVPNEKISNLKLERVTFYDQNMTHNGEKYKNKK